MEFKVEQRRRLGSLDLWVSPLGLGTVKLGRNTRVKYPTKFELPDDRQVSQLLGQAQDSGINLIDTAPAYGSSEARLGQLLPGLRSNWVICTKVGEQYQGQTSTYDFSAQATRRSLETSLRLLKTDYLDIVLVHCDDNDLRALQASGVLAELDWFRQRGYIKAIGASTKTLAAGLYAAEHTDLVMLAYNAEDQTQAPVMARAAALNKAVLLKKVLASGHIQATASAIGQGLAQPAVASAIVGTLNPAHLQDNVNAVLQGLKPGLPQGRS
jgi:aryl-alcohol dehydrogenase-like predicted oxidoreductase